MGFFKDLISQLENTTKQNKSESLIGQFITQNSLPADTISLQQLSRSYKEYATTKFDPYLQLPLLLERVVNSQIQDTAVKNTFLPELLDKKYLNYRNYEMTSPDRLELTLVFPVTTDLSLEMSLYTYFKQLPIKHMYLKFITRDNPSIVIKKQTLLSKQEIELYLAKWATQTQCSYFSAKEHPKCKYCTIKDLCQSERLQQVPVTNNQ